MDALADFRLSDFRLAGARLASSAATRSLPAFRAASNSELVAIVSSDAEKRKKLGKKYRLKHVYSYEEYDRALAEVDAVYLVVPNHLHKEYAVKAAQAGVHVLCEKPMVLHAPEAAAPPVTIGDDFSWSDVAPLVRSGTVPTYPPIAYLSIATTRLIWASSADEWCPRLSSERREDVDRYSAFHRRGRSH